MAAIVFLLTLDYSGKNNYCTIQTSTDGLSSVKQIINVARLLMMDSVINMKRMQKI